MAAADARPPLEAFAPPTPDRQGASAADWTLRNHSYVTWRGGYALIRDCEQSLREPDEALFERMMNQPSLTLSGSG